MEAINGFSYEEVNPSTCKEYVREYVSNSSAAENPDTEYDLDQAGEQLYEYMSSHAVELLHTYFGSESTSAFEVVPTRVLTDVCMACAREEA